MIRVVLPALTFAATNRPMKKSAVPRQPSYFDRYVDLTDDIELAEAFRQSIAEADALDRDTLRALGDRAYAPGKWAIRDILQHIIDSERVFAYRALRFARNDKTALPGFDEALFAAHAGAARRSLEDMLAEMRLVRQSSVALFDSFDEKALRRTGVMFNAELPVLAIGFTIVGHQKHHFRVMEERYFPLLKNA